MELGRDFYVGVVEDNKDPNRKGRIKIRVQTLYHSIPLEDIPYAYPFAGLAGKEFQVPAVGKLVNVLFLSDDLYSPYYIYSENYNVNLQNKLKDLSEEEYTNFIALLFDERTNIFADSKELTIDHLYNKMTINNTSINHELKDNTQRLNLGSKGAEQQAVLGTRFFEWMDRFIKEFMNPNSMIGNQGAPVLKTKLIKLCQEYQEIQADSKNFISKNVYIVDNDDVQNLERTPATVFEKYDSDLVIIMDQYAECSDFNPIDDKANKNLQNEIKKQTEKACLQGQSSASSNFTESNIDMSLPLVGDSISSRFGLRTDPTDSSKTQGHGGIDIVAKIGTPVKSPADGNVIAAGFDSTYGGGNFIRIKHSNNFVTGYAHLSEILVKPGQSVSKGDNIGLVGNTGAHTTGPHLHFTVTTPAKVKVDPELYFSWPDSTTAQTNTNNKYQGQEYQQPSTNNCAGKTADAEADPNEKASPLSTSFDDPSFANIVKLVINNLEGGYFHPDMLLDGRVKDKRYKKSGETLYGIDRQNGGKINISAAGKQFWKIIDDANARSTWKWNYFGGQYQAQLMPLVAEMMKPLYDDLSVRYLSTEALQIVNSDNKLLFHFVYATWNGSGFFQKFARIINDAVERSITDSQKLEQIAVDSRKNYPNSLIAQTGNKIQTLFDTNFA